MRRITAGVMGALILAGTAYGQERNTQERITPERNTQEQERQNTPRTNQDQQHSGEQKQACMASKLIGTTAQANNENLGRVQDLIIGKDGSIKYLVLTMSGTSATRPTDRDQQQPETANRDAQAGKLVLVPWQLAKLDAAHQQSGRTEREGNTSAQAMGRTTVMLDIDKTRLSQAPTFTEQELTQWLQKGEAGVATVDQFFNVREQRGASRPDLGRENNRQRNRSEAPRPTDEEQLDEDN